MPFASPRVVGDIVKAIAADVADADAKFQLAQVSGWNRMLPGAALLEGYDRLSNLGVSEVRVTLGLAASGAGWLCRTWRRLRGQPAPEPLYRPALDGDTVSMTITATVSRDPQGRWLTVVSSPES